jgi:Ca-activated chloride channel family protein
MAETPGRPVTGGPRHARTNRSGGTRTLVVLGVVVAIVVAAGLLTWYVRSPGTAGTTGAATTGAATTGAVTTPAGTAGPSGAGSSGATTADSGSALAAVAPPSDGCQGGVLRVAAAPEIAEVIAELTTAAAVDPNCRVEVTPADPAQVVADSATGVDVWIPDSSMWLARAESAGVAVPATGVSVATSPVVFALAPAAAAGLIAAGVPDLQSILATRRTATPIRIGLPGPSQSAAAVGAILAARAAVAGTDDARAALTWAVRSSPAGLPTDSAALLDRLAADPGTAVPVDERAVISHNEASPASPAVAVYPGAAGVALDYPVAILTDAPGPSAAAADLIGLLLDEQSRTALLDSGFRAPDGTPGPLMAASTGVNASVIVTAPLPDLASVDDAIRQVQITNEPSRMLAVMDVSGSMQAQVAGAGGADRMSLAKEAATRGLGLYPADSAIGLWVFSTNLTPTTDYREVIGVSTLGPDGQGGTGAQRLAQALGGIQAIPNGGTGLYDTVLDAVRTMRASWDPTKVNVVLLLTDGMNDDANGISLDALLSTLAAEQDPTRPVPVISIAFGPDSDVQSLGQISRATGGAAYVSLDPRQIGEIFLDAVGQRLCRPSC